MIIAIGTNNPIKIAAAKKALEISGIAAEVIPNAVDSGVRSQPMTNEEGIKGAINRAKNSMSKVDADMGIGMEGNVDQNRYGMFLTGWVAVMDKAGNIGIGSSGSILLPKRIESRLMKGEELGNVIDEMENSHGIKTNQGTMGVLTKGSVKREDEFTTATLLALARFLSREYYENED
ncbi:MAG: inosine/xanthosine triphosphatase [Methanothrix sp.]